MIGGDLVRPDGLLALFEAVEPELVPCPAIHPPTVRKAVEAVVERHRL